MRCPNLITHVTRRGDSLYHLARHYQTTVSAILALNPQINPNYMMTGTAITICPGNYLSMQNDSNISDCPDFSKDLTLLVDMREAWSQHVYWTRMLLISIAERLKDQQNVTRRLLRNPADIAEIFARYYPADTAKSIEQLLTEHLQIGAELITALRDKDSTKAQELQRQWYANADEMAEAFSEINPEYVKEEVRQMLYEHLRLTTDEVAMRLAGNYPADIDAFDKVEEEAMMMADYFTWGIIGQYPEKFR